jgi:hypothetical protein
MRLLLSSPVTFAQTGLGGFYVQFFNGLIVILALPRQLLEPEAVSGEAPRHRESSAPRSEILVLHPSDGAEACGKYGRQLRPVRLEFFGRTIFRVRPEALKPLRDLRLSSAIPEEQGCSTAAWGTQLNGCFRPRSSDRRLASRQRASLVPIKCSRVGSSVLDDGRKLFSALDSGWV